MKPRIPDPFTVAVRAGTPHTYEAVHEALAVLASAGCSAEDAARLLRSAGTVPIVSYASAVASAILSDRVERLEREQAERG